MGENIYRLRGPTTWAGPPDVFSHSALADIGECPRRWQLTHSQFGTLQRFPARPRPSSVEGQIIHALLERLFRALAIAGCPQIGSDEFRACVESVDLAGELRRQLQEHERRLSEHPRGAACRIASTAIDLRNRVIRLFRSEYRADGDWRADGRAERIGVTAVALTCAERAGEFARGPAEIRLEHPSLPFVGVIDLVRYEAGRPVIVDFKTGQAKAEHRGQVRTYALLWLRCRGELPSRAQVRYPSGTVQVAISERDLFAAETELAERISGARTALESAPAPCSPGEQCRWCDVRQYCDDYWTSPQPRAQNAGSFLDVQVAPIGVPSCSGFTARDGVDKEMHVVFDEQCGVLHGPFKAGEVVRVLGAVRQAKNEVRLIEASEVFHR